MYKVKYLNEVVVFDTLNKAMEFAKQLDVVVEIITPNHTIVGKFGVDSIVEGKCPDGITYEWKKRRK